MTLALRLAGLNTRVIGYVDNEPFIRKLLRQRIEDELIDDAPIIGIDIRSFDFSVYSGLVDIITAGFPCPPFSHAGKRRGKTDERNMWPATLSVIQAIQPRYVILENVDGILSSTGTSEVESTGSELGDATTGASGYAATVIGQLSEIGFSCTWGIISASNAGAPHGRKRWWCFAWKQDDSKYTSNVEDSSRSGARDKN